MSDTPTTSASDAPRRPPPDRHWRERLDDVISRSGVDVSPVRLLAIGVAVVIALTVGVIALRPSSSPPPPETTLPRASSKSESESAEPAPASTQLVVQAAGAVVHPGVYTLASTARVTDLITAAGGLTPDADPDQIELAATLTDGERVYVPKVGESPPPVVGGGSTASSGAPHTPIDLNRATAADLDSLPGIGPSLAQAIIDYRAQHGPFRSVEDLADVRGIGPAKLEQLRPLVRV